MSVTTYSTANHLIKCALACALAILLTGCRSNARPQPSQAPGDPIPTATETDSKPISEFVSGELKNEEQMAEAATNGQPVHNADAQAAEEVIHFGTVEDMTFTLPDGWETVTLGPEELKDWPNRFALSGAIAQAFLDGIGNETSLLAAVHPGPYPLGTPEPIMMLTVIPRHGLKLEQYIGELSAALASEPGIAVERTGLLYDVRVDGTPVGIVTYHLPPSNGRPGLKAYHLVQLDGAGENLVAMNWVATSDVLDTLLPKIHAVAASVALSSTRP